MPVFKHPEPPLNINGEIFSAIELLEAGIAYLDRFFSDSSVTPQKVADALGGWAHAAGA